MQIAIEDIREVIAKYPKQGRFSLAVMQDMQRSFGYIPREGLEIAAEYLGLGVASLYSMATFYKALSLRPKGRHIIKLCDGTACHIRGSSVLVDGIKRILGISPGESTDDGLFSLETVNCLGACAMSPVMLIDGDVYGQVTVDKLPEIFKKYREEAMA